MRRMRSARRASVRFALFYGAERREQSEYSSSAALSGSEAEGRTPKLTGSGAVSRCPVRALLGNFSIVIYKFLGNS